MGIILAFRNIIDRILYRIVFVSKLFCMGIRIIEFSLQRIDVFLYFVRGCDKFFLYFVECFDVGQVLDNYIFVKVLHFPDFLFECFIDIGVNYPWISTIVYLFLQFIVLGDEKIQCLH